MTVDEMKTAILAKLAEVNDLAVALYAEEWRTDFKTWIGVDDVEKVKVYEFDYFGREIPEDKD